MYSISIQIPAVHGRYLRRVLESIRLQSFQDYEVIVVNSGTDKVSDLIREYGFREIRGRALKLLEARYLASIEGRGEYAFLLDETRSLREDALEILSSNLHDMVIVGEREVGDSLWVRLAQLDKDNILECNAPEAIRGFALPRLFRSYILRGALERLKEKLKETFRDIVFPDHELIYKEASLLSGDVFVLREKLILHHGDASLGEIVRKYYRYGRTLKALRNTPYSYFTSLGRKRRRICAGRLRDRALLSALYVARGIPLAAGYYLP